MFYLSLLSKCSKSVWFFWSSSDSILWAVKKSTSFAILEIAYFRDMSMNIDLEIAKLTKDIALSKVKTSEPPLAILVVFIKLILYLIKQPLFQGLHNFFW